MTANLFKKKTSKTYKVQEPIKDLLYICDGNFFLHRAKHAMKDITFTRSSDGLDTTIIKGFLNMLCSELSLFQPTYAAVVFDGPGKNFRYRLYPEYKQNRKTDDSTSNGVKDNSSAIMWESMNYLRDLLEYMGIQCFQLPKVEGDDVVATLAYLSDNTIPTIISSADKDMHSILDVNVHQYNGITKQVMTPKKVYEKFGVTCEQMVDYLSLLGDKVDNIQGIPGIGRETALRILNKYTSIDNFLSKEFKSTDVRHKLQIKIKENNISLWQKLITLQVVDLYNKEKEDLSIEDLLLQEPDVDNIKMWIKQMEFKSYPAYLQKMLGEEVSLRTKRLL